MSPRNTVSLYISVDLSPGPVFAKTFGMLILQFSQNPPRHRFWQSSMDRFALVPTSEPESQGLTVHCFMLRPSSEDHNEECVVSMWLFGLLFV